jgi:hypothetical protein
VSAKRRQGRENAFGDNNSVYPMEEATLEGADSSIFGKIAEIDEGRQIAKPISIFDIYPDPVQPRRAIPSPVRQNWDGRTDTLADILNYWNTLVIEERGGSLEFNLEPYLVAQDEAPRPEKIGPIEASLLDIVELAASIRKNGLTNPITITQAGDVYRLETGERRWMAYHLLYAFFTAEQKNWEKIPARVVKYSDVWRQAAENGVRANLNAISRARQLALLIMEIYRNHGTTFKSYEEMVKSGMTDRAYYAQVSDGVTYDTPKGQGEAILNAMGLKQPSQMREYRGLLRLPDEVWQIADDLNWTQGRIRALQRKVPEGGKKFISLVVSQAQTEGYRVGFPTVTSPTPSSEKSKVDQNPFLSGKKRKYLGNMKRLARRVGEGGGPTSQDDLDDIRDMRNWLDDLEQIVRDNLRK